MIHLGLAPKLMDGKHDPCLHCGGGKDRFRAIDPDNGVLYCNQYFYEKNGDIFAAVQWMLNCKFSEAVNMIGDYLNSSHPQPVKRQEPTPKKKAPAFDDQIQFIEIDQDKINSWVKHKLPATAKAALPADVRLGSWPKKAPQSKRFECLAFPAYRESNAPTAWILYRLDGSNFPAIPKRIGERKTHLLRSSVDGWILFGDRPAQKAAKVIWEADAESNFSATTNPVSGRQSENKNHV